MAGKLAEKKVEPKPVEVVEEKLTDMVFITRFVTRDKTYNRGEKVGLTNKQLRKFRKFKVIVTEDRYKEILEEVDALNGVGVK